MVLALAFGVVLGMIFDNSALEMALGLALVLSAGLFTARK